jgi:hypothetical protein
VLPPDDVPFDPFPGEPPETLDHPLPAPVPLPELEPLSPPDKPLFFDPFEEEVPELVVPAAELPDGCV